MVKLVTARLRQNAEPEVDNLHCGQGTRLARMQDYLARTHDEFVANLKLACELGLPDGGVLAGPVKSRQPTD